MIPQLNIYAKEKLLEWLFKNPRVDFIKFTRGFDEIHTWISAT